MNQEIKYNYKYIWLISLVAAMGGFLFGYDWVVIGGAKPFYEPFFGLTTPAMKGWATSSAMIGCLLGAVGSGVFSDRYGRKRLMLLSGLIFLVSSIGVGLANEFSVFIIYRIIGGVAIGLASNLSPMYIAEVSPASVRGRFVSINQLTIAIGVLMSQLVNWLISISHEMPDHATVAQISESWNGQVGWRWMFAACAVPSLLFFMCSMLIPESPRWLVKNRNSEKAYKILEKIGGSQYAREELSQIEISFKYDTRKVHFRELLDKGVVKILAIGMFLAFFQQWCGINTIYYYAEDVFKAAGFDVKDVMFNIVITGIISMVFTFVAIGNVDKYGRKVLLLIGSLGLSVTFGLIGLCYLLHLPGFILLALTVTAIAFYSFSLAPIVWVLLSEIFPNRIRGVAMSIAVFTLWTGNFTLSYSFPALNEGIGTTWTFWIYGIICLAGFLIINRYLVETKGKTLEQIEKEING
ncbi:MAG: sugar porter family MFS transporter [Saprospiraceae bacterium]